MYSKKNDYNLIDFIDKETIVSNKKFDDPVLFFTKDNPVTMNHHFHPGYERTLRFINCYFEEGFVTNIISHSPTDEGKLRIYFDNCFIDNYHKDITNIIKISKESPLKLELTFVKCIITDLELEDCEFEDLTLIQCLTQRGRIIVRDTKIPSITIMNSLGNFYVSNCIETKLSITFHDNNLVIEHTHLSRLLYKILKKENYENVFEYKGLFNISNVKDTHLKFQKSKEEGTKKEHTPIGVGKFKKELKRYLNKDDIDKLNISIILAYSGIEKPKLLIEDAILRSLQINGRTDSIIMLNNIQTNSFYLSEFSSSKAHLFNISSIGQKCKFQLHNSELSNVWFNKVNLKSFEAVNFYRTTLEDTRFTGTQFPASIESLPNIHYPKKRSHDFHVEQYENYRQLKKALLDQGNIVQALTMHDKMYEAIAKDNNLEKQDKFILGLNKLSNRHGTSIINAFLLFLAMIFTLHILNMVALPSAPYDWGWAGFQPFLITIKDTLVFIFYSQFNKLIILANPAHRIDDLSLTGSQQGLSTGNYFISFFSRILMAWAFYQFAMAFRKFGRN